MNSVFTLTLRQLSGKWRMLIMLALAALPMIMALGFVLEVSEEARLAADAIEEFDTVVLSTLLAGSIAPLVVLAIASAAFANEIEDRTLANLTLAPIPRWQIVMPKLLATVTLSGPFIAVSALVSSQIAFGTDVRALVAVTIASVVGVLLYSSAFIWLGLMTTRAIGFGLVYVVVWEGLFAQFVTGVRFLSIRYYTVALMHGLDERRFATSNTVSFEFAIGASVVVFAGFLLLAIRRLRRMDVP
jgi:ABC-2 type transport system permease protein